MVETKKHLEFLEDENYKGKTKKFVVWNKEGDELGEIKWYGAWRQYVFEPLSVTYFSSGCLTELAEFIQKLMKERKNG